MFLFLTITVPTFYLGYLEKLPYSSRQRRSYILNASKGGENIKARKAFQQPPQYFQYGLTVNPYYKKKMVIILHVGSFAQFFKKDAKSIKDSLLEVAQLQRVLEAVESELGFVTV